MKNELKEKTTALQKMQEIAQKLTSNTPQLNKYLQSDSILRQKKEPSVPNNKSKKQQNSQLLGLKNEMTSNDYFERCKELMNELNACRDKNLKLENDLEVYKQRFVEREIEYRKIIEELQQELKNKSMLDPNEKSKMQQIFDLHAKIMDNITSIHNKTSKILIQQESDISRMFQKKIAQLKSKFNEQKISKGEKDHEHLQKEKQLESQLQWLKNIAQKIESQNQTLVKKYSELKSEFQIQQNDRDMLLRELLMKKKKIAVLTNQVEQYEKLLQEVSQEAEQRQEHVEESQDTMSNKFKQLKEEYSDPRRAMNTINTLKSTLAKEQKRVRQLKNSYMRQLESKGELQKILRGIVDDIKEQIVEIRAEARSVKKKEDDFGKEARQALLEKLLNNEKIMTLIYDKTFFPDIKRGEKMGRSVVNEQAQLEGFLDD